MAAKDGLSFNSATICDEIGLGPFTGVRVPSGYVICTFCARDGKVGRDMLTPKITATTAVMKPRKILSSNMSQEGVYLGDKIVHIVDEMTACPNHAGQLLDGKKVVGLKWPTMRG